jgi:outer membrane protein OmpA-like peptidoglycan-associated protein
MFTRRVLCILLVGVLLAGTLSCASMSKTEKGAVIGAAGGAAAGAVIGKAAGNTVAGALIGAAIGGTAGAIIGNYMDRQAAELERDLEGARVERIGEGIKITFGSGLLFQRARHDLKPEAQENLSRLAVILNKYSDTQILIEGHTDADGALSYNQKLSERRAMSVRSFLGWQEVETSRMTPVGYGEHQPVADNTTPEGKQANRRVEVAIWANDELKKAAERQALMEG